MVTQFHTHLTDKELRNPGLFSAALVPTAEGIPATVCRRTRTSECLAGAATQLAKFEGTTAEKLKLSNNSKRLSHSMVNPLEPQVEVPDASSLRTTTVLSHNEHEGPDSQGCLAEAVVVLRAARVSGWKFRRTRTKVCHLVPQDQDLKGCLADHKGQLP